MILGLTRPDHGNVSVFGLAPTAAVRAGKVGGMLQSGSPLDHLRVRELVALMGSYYPHPLDVDYVLRLTGTDGFAKQWTTKLSGGQAQRVRFAASIVGDPELLVLDEPTEAIDVAGRHEFWQAMRALAERGKTIVFATHYLEEADAFADRIVIMARGRIVADRPAPWTSRPCHLRERKEPTIYFSRSRYRPFFVAAIGVALVVFALADTTVSRLVLVVGGIAILSGLAKGIADLTRRAP